MFDVNDFVELDLIRGCKYPEDDAKHVMVQILDVVAYCHLQGVVRRDLKPQVYYIVHESWTIIMLSIKAPSHYD